MCLVTGQPITTQGRYIFASSNGSHLIPLSHFQIPLGGHVVFELSINGRSISSGSCIVTEFQQQAPVLWGAYNGTGPQQGYTFSSPTGPSSSSLPQTSVASSSSQWTTTLEPSQGGTTPASSQSLNTSIQSKPTSSSSQSTTTPSSSHSTTTSSSSQPTTIAVPPQAPQSLSTGAEVGIIIACVMGGISLMAWLRESFKMRKGGPSQTESDPVPEAPPDMVERPEGEVYEIDRRERAQSLMVLQDTSWKPMSGPGSSTAGRDMSWKS